MNITIYVASHRQFDVPPDPMYCPLHVGHAVSTKEYGYLADDTGANISVKNCYYGELTGLYWIWKNDVQSDYIGLCHYRRFFVDERGKLLTSAQYQEIWTRYDVVAAVSNTGGQSYYELYKEAHHIKDLEVTGQVLKERYPKFGETYDRLIYGNRSYTGNLFVMSRELFMEYADWLFSILFEVERRIHVEDYDDYHKRVFGFLSEQLLGVWIEAKGLRCLECRVGMFQEKAESLELKKTLQEFMYVEDYAAAVNYFERMIEKRPDVLLANADLSGELQNMYQVLTICMQEEQFGIEGLKQHSCELRQLIPIVKSCEKILGRIWKHEERQQDLEYLEEKHVSWVMCVAVILNMTELSNEIVPMLNCLAMYFFNHKCYDRVIPFLDYAYGLDQQDHETKRNLITVLEALGESDLAETFR